MYNSHNKIYFTSMAFQSHSITCCTKHVAFSYASYPFLMLLNRAVAVLRGYVPLTGLLRGHFVLIVVEVFPAEQETKLWVVLLLVLSHLFKFWSVASDKLR